jgi:hypothetical protein
MAISVRTVDSPLTARSSDAGSPAQRLVSHMALAAMGFLIFQLLMMTSGRIDAGDGLGWDGHGYASLMTDGLDQGSVVTRSRPLIPLITRIPYALGFGVTESFQLMNGIYAFTLYLFIALVIDLYDTRVRVKAIVISNLALCIATSKMFAYYPVQIDLGAFALMTAAFYFVMTDRHWLAGAVCTLALAAREFGVAVLLCGVYRAFRRGRLWPDGLWYLPGVAMVVLVRTMTASEGSLSTDDVVANIKLWLIPGWVAIFLYFVVTVFGGISAILAVHPRWCFARLRQEPEIATLLVVSIGLAAVGKVDVWRYLAFALPAVVALISMWYRDRAPSPARERAIAAAMTFVTVFTQRPFEQMNQVLYFQDWFPLYNVIDATNGIINETPSPELLTLWGVRLAALILVVIALAAIARSDPEFQDSAS